MGFSDEVLDAVIVPISTPSGFDVGAMPHAPDAIFFPVYAISMSKCLVLFQRSVISRVLRSSWGKVRQP
jgi:hypothetical protein